MRRRLAFALVALGCLLAAPSANAAYEPLGSGATKLTLERSFVAALKSEGIKLQAQAPAKLKGNTVSFPVAAGKFDPTNERGTVEHEGALLFKAAGKSVPIKALQLKTTQKRAPLSAKVGGSQLKLASAKGLEASRSGFGERLSVSGLALSAKLATRLAKKLDARDLFKAGMAFGHTVTQANPETIALAQKNKAELSLAPGFQAKLGSLFVAANPVFPAERPGAFTLPIAGGTIAPDASQGTIETQGALELLQLGGGQVLWGEARVDLALKALVAEVELLPSPGKAGALAIGALAPTAVAADPKARTVSFAGTLFLDAGMAAALNEAFAKPQGKAGVFVGGEALGGLSFVAAGQ